MQSTSIARHCATARWPYAELVIAIICPFLFCYGLWGVEDFIAFDSRFGLFAREMLRHGTSFFPTTYGSPYPDYPATSTWLIWLIAHISGSFNLLIAVLPSALAATLTLILLYRLLAKYSITWGWLAVAFALLTQQFIVDARIISLDQMVATVTMSAFYVAHQADTGNRPRLLGWILLLCAVGFAIRGPIGLVIPTAAVTAYFLLMQRWRWIVIFGCCSLLVLLLCMLLWLGAAWLDGESLLGLGGGDQFIKQVIHWQVGLRLLPQTSKEPVLYYVSQSLHSYALSYPLGLLTLLVLLFSWRSPVEHPAWRRIGLAFAACSLLILIGMSVPTEKKMRYLLPMVPGFAVLAAYPMIVRDNLMLMRLGTLYRWLLLLFPGCCALLLFLVPVLGQEKLAAKGIDISPWLFTARVLAYAFSIVQLLSLLLYWRRRGAGLAAALLAVATLWLTLALLVGPIQREVRNTRQFTLQVEQIRSSAPAPLLLYKMGKDAMAIKYMVNLQRDEQPLFADSLSGVQILAAPLWVVGEVRELQALKAQLSDRLQVTIPATRFDGKQFALYRLVQRAE